MFDLVNAIPPPFDERPMPRFCVANNCGRMIFPEPFQHESNLCDVCIRIRSCDPFPVANNSINGDTSQSFVFTSSGGFPHELHGNTFRQPGGSNYVPLSPSSMRSGHPPIHHATPSVYSQQPQPISHLQNLGPDRMTYITHRPEVFAGTSQRISDRNVRSNTGYPAPGLRHEFVSQNRQRTLQLRPLHCEECRVFMSNRLVGNGKVCSSCLFRHGTQRTVVSAKPSSPFLNPEPFKHREVIDLTGDDGDRFALMADTASAVKTLSSPPNRIKESSSDQSPPSKRQRFALNATDKRVDQPTMTAEGNAPKTCKKPGCDQTIPVESCSSRCISCVKLDWKSIKAQFKTFKPRLPSTIAKLTEGKPRKSVTWSDTVTVTSGDGAIVQCLAHDVEDDRLSPIATHVVDTIDDDICEMDMGSSTDSTCLELDPRPVETQGVRLPPLEKPITSITGWDSDLSVLTESDESDSPSDPPQIPAPTGLKIRIPARSSIFCSRKCKNPSCSRVLPTSYTRKSCVICRVQRRQIRQIRKGLHDKDDVTMLDDPPKLFANARLCSENRCTHLIPPYEEYKFKRCSLCRLYQDERRLLRRKLSHQSDSTEPLVDVKKIYNSFRLLPVRSPTLGRCPSLDCCLLHEDGTISCPQCVSRQTRLMKKAGIQEEHRDVTAKQDKQDSYPQYISFVVLRSDFEGRLKAFLKSQSIFFLFRVHNPPVIGTKALFSFDGEYSMVALDFDVVGRKAKMELRALKTKKDLEGIEGLKFAPKRLISVLEGGGVAVRFRCTYQASILKPRVDENAMTVSETMKPMEGELEIAVFPDHSHRCLPGEKTIIRFRLLG